MNDNNNNNNKEEANDKQTKDEQVESGSTTDLKELMDEVWVRSVELKLTYLSLLARRLNHIDILGLEKTIREVCTDYYASLDDSRRSRMKKRNRRHRHLQSQQQQERRRDARDVIQNTVVFVRQDLSYDANDMPISVIVYDQQFVFDPTSSSTDDKERDDNAAALILTPMEIAKLPFNESD